MLNVSSQQMATLAAVPGRVFAEEMVAHLRDLAPRLFELRGADCVRNVVHAGMERAFDQGFTMRGTVRLWLELVFCHGHRFDNDPALPWAENLLDTAELHQQERARLLFEAMQTQVAITDGDDKIQLISTLAQLANADWDAMLAQPGNQQQPAAALEHIFAPRCAAIGSERLHSLLGEAAQVCDIYELHAPGSLFLVSGLMLGFGHGVVDDPLYPWVAQTLAIPRDKPQDAPADEAARRTTALARKAKAYVRAVYQHLSS